MSRRRETRPVDQACRRRAVVTRPQATTVVRMGALVRDLEQAVLQAIVDSDRTSLERLLTEDFVITTAGWLHAPATRTEWLGALAGLSLREFDIVAVEERPVADATVALV